MKGTQDTLTSFSIALDCKRRKEEAGALGGVCDQVSAGKSWEPPGSFLLMISDLNLLFLF